MKIVALTIVILSLNGYVTKATILDPHENVEMDYVKNGDDNARSKRSDIFSSLVKKKLGLFSSLVGSSSGKSIGHSEEHYEEPLSYQTKTFDLWGVKKAIMSSVLQAAKAITGGVIAIKGQLIKAKGHAVVAKGKLMQTKGEAISNFGKTIATHAFDVPQHEPSYEVQSSGGYGAATGLGGYSGNAYPSGGYPSNAYSNNGYQVAAPSYPTGFAAIPQTGYGGGSSYGGYGGNGYSAKRTVHQNTAQESTINQVKSPFDKDSVRAGLLIFKPIKMHENLGTSTSSQSAGVQQTFGQQPSQSNGVYSVADFQKTPQSLGHRNPFTGSLGVPQTDHGYQTVPQANTVYQAVPQANHGYQTAAAAQTNGGYQVPQSNGGYSSYQDPGGYSAPNSGYSAGGGSGGSVEQLPSGLLQGFGFQNSDYTQPANGQEFDQQLVGFSGQQQQRQTSYSQANDYGGDQTDSASSSEEERVAQHHAQTRVRQTVEKPKRKTTATTESSDRFASDFFLPTATGSKKRSAPQIDVPVVTVSSSRDGVIVPLKYQDGTSAEEQARLKQTVERFFNMLHKQRCEYNDVARSAEHFYVQNSGFKNNLKNQNNYEKIHSNKSNVVVNTY